VAILNISLRNWGTNGQIRFLKTTCHPPLALIKSPLANGKYFHSGLCSSTVFKTQITKKSLRSFKSNISIITVRHLVSILIQSAWQWKCMDMVQCNSLPFLANGYSTDCTAQDHGPNPIRPSLSKVHVIWLISWADRRFTSVLFKLWRETNATFKGALHFVTGTCAGGWLGWLGMQLTLVFHMWPMLPYIKQWG